MNHIKMKKIMALLLAAVLLMSAAACSAGGSNHISSNQENTKGNTSGQTAEYEKLFQKDDVIDIKVEISDTDWKTILASPQEEEYKSAKVTVDGLTVDHAGFRTKGNSTLRSVAESDSDRYSFRIKLDKYVEGQTLLGLDEFVVNNMYADPSYLREYLSYEALRAIGEEVPDAVFANLYINGKLYGFYLCIEALDESFVETSFQNADGNLYKMEQGSTLQYVEGSNYDTIEQKNGEDESKADLKNFIKVLNDMPVGEKGNIESVLDVDSALKYIAANTVLGSYDSYSGSMAQNFYIYGQKGRFTVIPWDYNMSFGGFGMGGEATTIPMDEPVNGVHMTERPLISKLLAVPEYKEKYHGYIKELLTYLKGFESRVGELSDILRPYVEKDPTRFYTMEQFEANIKYSETAAVNTPANENHGVPLPQGQRPPQGEQPPQGLPPEGAADANLQKGDRSFPAQGGMQRGGGMGSGNVVSIINFIRQRVENMEKQLAGELPTTGNTTMNSNRGFGKGQNNRQQ
jgi:spore coat protein H